MINVDLTGRVIEVDFLARSSVIYLDHRDSLAMGQLIKIDYQPCWQYNFCHILVNIIYSMGKGKTTFCDTHSLVLSCNINTTEAPQYLN